MNYEKLTSLDRHHKAGLVLSLVASVSGISVYLFLSPESVLLHEVMLRSLIFIGVVTVLWLYFEAAFGSFFDSGPDEVYEREIGEDYESE